MGVDEIMGAKVALGLEKLIVQLDVIKNLDPTAAVVADEDRIWIRLSSDLRMREVEKRLTSLAKLGIHKAARYEDIPTNGPWLVKIF